MQVGTWASPREGSAWSLLFGFKYYYQVHPYITQKPPLQNARLPFLNILRVNSFENTSTPKKGG